MLCNMKGRVGAVGSWSVLCEQLMLCNMKGRAGAVGSWSVLCEQLMVCNNYEMEG